MHHIKHILHNFVRNSLDVSSNLSKITPAIYQTDITSANTSVSHMKMMEASCSITRINELFIAGINVNFRTYRADASYQISSRSRAWTRVELLNSQVLVQAYLYINASERRSFCIAFSVNTIYVDFKITKTRDRTLKERNYGRF